MKIFHRRDFYKALWSFKTGLQNHQFPYEKQPATYKLQEHYPEELRLVTTEVEIKGKMVVMTFITNNSEWSSFTICQLYQCR